MRAATPPQVSAAQAFSACVSGVQDVALQKRLTTVALDVTLAANAFDVAARTTTLHLLQSTSTVGGVVSKEEMTMLYQRYMVRRNGRSIYNQIKLGAADGVCLLCGHLRVATLDHHLPKSLFPALAVAPTNLVPCCTSCNMAKLARAPSCAEEETLHPYFDNVDGDRWLVADVKPTAMGPTLHFKVRAPSAWPDLLRTRTTYHFKILKLATLYLTQAQQELSNIRHLLVTLHTNQGIGAVRDHLALSAESRRAVRLNSWQTAMYEALAGDTWFCEQGLYQIPDPKAAA